MVTGCSGFVGSNLVQTLRSNSMNVRAVSRENRPNVERIRSYDPETDWTPYLQGVDCIVHLAARVHVMRETVSDPMEAFRKVNCHATINLARQAASAGVRRFVFVSTIKVNGERTQEGLPFTSASPPNPQDPYAISKFEAERDLFTLGKSTGMEISVVRPPLVYGPGVGGNFKLLMKWAKIGLPSIFPKVTNRRSMIYIENLTNLLMVLVDHPSAANRIFLASDAECLSTHEILTQLTVATGNIPFSIPLPMPLTKWLGRKLKKQEALRRLTENLEIDGSETSRVLAWQPPFSVHAGLQITARN